MKGNKNRERELNLKGHLALSTLFGSNAALMGATATTYPMNLLTPVAVAGALGLGASSAKFSIEGLKKYFKENHPKTYDKFISLPSDTQEEIHKEIKEASDYIKDKKKITKKRLKEMI